MASGTNRKLTPEIDALLAGHRERITWEADLHSVADLKAPPFAPRMVTGRVSLSLTAARGAGPAARKAAPIVVIVP
jgi:hypothetical protein